MKCDVCKRPLEKGFKTLCRECTESYLETANTIGSALKWAAKQAIKFERRRVRAKAKNQ